MDVIIRNDLFTSYTGLIERVMRTNHRMLCTLSMEMEDIYQELSLALDCTAEVLDPGLTQEELPRLALRLALRSYADRLACQRILELLRERRPQPENNRK